MNVVLDMSVYICIHTYTRGEEALGRPGRPDHGDLRLRPPQQERDRRGKYYIYIYYND